jgi:hypothetical protein
VGPNQNILVIPNNKNVLKLHEYNITCFARIIVIGAMPFHQLAISSTQKNLCSQGKVAALSKKVRTSFVR